MFWLKIIKIVVTVALLGWVLSQIEVDQVWELMREVDIWAVVAVLALMMVNQALGALRWWGLLKAQDIEVGLLQAFRLTLIGAFFNNVMPGLTGGDIAKAVMVSRQTERRAVASVTVVADRLIGLIGLTIVGAVATGFWSGDVAVGFAPKLMSGLVVAIPIGVVLYFSKFMRRLIHFEAILKRLPKADFIRTIDQAFFDLGKNKRVMLVSFGLTVVIHLITISTFFILARGLGLEGPQVTWLAFVALIPTTLVISALPISIAGLGVGESLMIMMLVPIGIAQASALTLQLLFRLCVLLLGLPGGLLLMGSKKTDLAKAE